MNPILSQAIDRANVLAQQYGTSAIFGAAVINQAENTAAPRNISFTMFADGDVVTVPPFPIEGSAQETDKQWVAKPLNQGGRPVLSVFCEVHNELTGVDSVKELFAGTLVKNAMEEGTGKNYGARGDVPAAVATLATVKDMFVAVAGKKIKFSEPKTFKTRRRDFSGKMPDRIADTTVFKIDFA